MMNSEIKRIANSYAEEFCSDAIYPSHLFKAVLHKDMGLVHFLETELDKDYFYLQDWADIQMQLSPRATRPSSDLELSDEGQAVMDEAFSYQEKFGMSSCEPICVLASLVTPGVGFTFDQLKTLPLNATEICNKIGIKTSADGTVVASATTPTAKSVTGKGVVQQYCINKIEEVQAGKIAPVVGFENEISTIFEILGRKTKSNLLITGESGVGKTSLINGFATQLAQGRMPSFLNNAKLYELDLAALSADASYKGEIEDRFKKVLAEIRETENAILVIESIDKLFDKQGSLYGAATMLKQELGKGNLLLLCTSSIDGYTKNIETDKEFVTKLEKISLEEPNADLCLRILKGALPTYENFHHLSIAEPVMADAIRLAKRYLTEKALPDSAFDLIDHTMALLKTMNDMSATDLASMEEKLNSLQSADPKMTEEEQMKELEWLNYEMLHKTSCILLAQLDTDTDFSKLPTVEKRVSYLQKSLQQLAGLAAEKRTSVESADLYAVVAKQTGIPLGKVQSKERDRLVNAEGTLKKRVVGQDHAVKIVLDAVFESRSGLNKKGQPMGSFFFLGPTGTGKTELSKALAAFLFEDESALIRFDMSEFK
ncbi:MAG: AAA family ATPase, partial [Parabacteroides sp.]|nr:AAA family ATPase [Parabacteroides sp.]